MLKIRKSAVKGMFYDDDPEHLKNQIDSFFSKSLAIINPKSVLGLVIPHAGYVYSGQIAAKGIYHLKNYSFERAIVIGPSHYEYFDGAAIYDGDAFETTFGEIYIDKDFVDQIVKNSTRVFKSNKGEKKEHSIEVILPFLQFVNKNIKFVPLLLGDQTFETVNDVALALSKVLDEKTIICSSSDLSHFYKKSVAKKLDERVLNSISKIDGDELLSNVENGLCEACGAGAIAILLKAANLKGYDKSQIIAYGDSGDVSGDNDRVVGYVSAIIYKE